MSVLDAFSLAGKVAIVTGGGAGIGRAIAELFAGAGAAIVVSDLKQDTADEVAEGIVAAGGRAIGVPCDVTDAARARPSSMPRWRGSAGSRSWSTTRAAAGRSRSTCRMDTFTWAYELNVFSLFHLSQLCAPHIARAGGGAILNISSMAGENRNVRMASYGSSKAAANHLTRNIAFDLGPMGIRVNAIAPGAIRTAALQSVLTPEVERAMLKHTPLGRLGEGNDIAYAALFLCSPAAAWVSGQVLTVSGGGVQELD